MASDSKNILIVDDEVDITEIISAYVADLGYCPIASSSAHDALVKAQGRTIDLAVIDIMMPEVSGMHLVKSLREGGFRFPIIVFSGNFPRDIGDYLWEFDIFTILEKPINAHQFKTVIHQALRMVPA